eukprot:TRINITY_DN15971_c0_g1_i1.p1 TRINITY_DN15971_c0_g1~~TRINITY_DN15971_c0_g1_i1.p1  ORF type:complete len:1228 (+),score=186.64 TRINITY_DN15971_c0_g1_i1:119-3802(+)
MSVLYAGVFAQQQGAFGFIDRLGDAGTEKIFVIPSACVGFNGRLPAIGTPVTFEMVVDARTGRERAENVQPDGAAEQLEEDDLHHGTFAQLRGTYGFIKSDSGESIFAIQSSFAAMKGFPPIGTRVAFKIVTDATTGRPRADEVVPEGGGEQLPAAGDDATPDCDSPLPAHGAVALGDRIYVFGTMERHAARNRSFGFGFIKPDSEIEGQDDVRCHISACTSFGSALPPVGSRVAFTLVERNKKLVAGDVQPEVNVIYDAMLDLSPDAAALAMEAGGSLAATGELHTGVILQNGPTYGFIQQDMAAEKMFVIPSSCSGFDGKIPPLGTRVTYTVVMDQKTGRPRAENVEPGRDDRAAAAAKRLALPEGVKLGTMDKNRGNFGFIAQDDGGEMFVLPSSCTGFAGAFPLLGTRVAFTVVLDGKTGHPRAEDVHPAAVVLGAAAPAAVAVNAAARGPRVGDPPSYVNNSDQNQPTGVKLGVMARDEGKFGFIVEDASQAEWFVMPSSCAAFANNLPPIGMRVVFTAVTDAKTGRPRADDVRPEADDMAGLAAAQTWTSQGEPKVSHRPRGAFTANREPQLPAGVMLGAMHRDKGKFGFILQDDGQTEWFVIPSSCIGFGYAFPPIGTRVAFAQTTDAKTGAPRADRVHAEAFAAHVLEDEGGQDQGAEEAGHTSLLPVGVQLGTMMDKMRGKFGFIAQDDGGEMFVLPLSCTGFGGSLPEIGSRVAFTVVTDAKTGQPRAEDVQPAEAVLGTDGADSSGPTALHPAHGTIPHDAGSSLPPGVEAGVMQSRKERFGFIERDAGGEMFVLPSSCTGFGGTFPPVGCRVAYTVVTDAKTGQPRADDVHPEEDLLGVTARPDIRFGTMHRHRDKFGFILDEDGQSEWFVLPLSCTGFGGSFPPLGTPVTFTTVTDAKTGQPRAAEVQPAEAFTAPTAHHAVDSRRQSHTDTGVGEGVRLGTMHREQGNFGFILDEDGQSEWFVMPLGCTGFGGSFPPLGTRVAFTTVNDAKTGRPRAEDVQPAEAFEAPAARAVASRPPKVSRRRQGSSSDGHELTGIVTEDHGDCGVIQPDDGTQPVFLMARDVLEQVLPPVGTLVSYSLATDPDSRLRQAYKVQVLGAGMHKKSTGQVKRSAGPHADLTRMPVKRSRGTPNNGGRPAPGVLRGSFVNADSGSSKFAFIVPDCGGDKVFVLPGSCEGGAFPPVGTPVVYEMVQDAKTGRMRAENVRAEAFAH